MRAHYDFAGMKSRKNPYARRLRESITIRLDSASVSYFRELAAETGLPYQNLINLYLRDCAEHRRRLSQRWVTGDRKVTADS
jgi:predicted DNA binding CopG/RHH family protein